MTYSAILWIADLPFSVAWLLQSTGTSPPPSKGVAYEQEGTWPPSGGEVLCTGSLTSLPGFISSCQVTVPELSYGLLVWRQKCSRITLKVSWAYGCPSPSLVSQPKKMNYLCGMSAYVICPWYKIPVLSQFSKQLLFCRAPTSFLVYYRLFRLEGEKGDVSSLGMGQQHWFNLVSLSYLFIRLLVLRVTSRISDSHLWIYSNLWI